MTFAVALTFVAVLGLGTASILKVEQKALEDETDLVFNLLSKSVIPERYNPASFFKKRESNSSKVTAFQWMDCGGMGAHIKSLSLSPDPLKFPGTMTIGASAIISTKLDSPLQANVTIEKKVGSTYVKIPCIDDFGSCVYDDLCDILDGATCPDVLTKNGINCNCPFDVKTYTLPPSPFDAGSLYFPSGDYHARGELRSNGKFMACLDIHLSIATN
ncbi:ganglioside GM2 activator-like [Mizuhopecten yessoensis]|uniref:Ganglioside GM2 activator n=1 Tax=Mizuhopecten yessoensis TaxID=6573 RepID=A0A210PXT0_MIZYE|nr:ganglioside GM2 activator-like [Mizuhopecten yessoensis]OWF41286.1 Ganglioside GM2 activator [Mizuhopecten yessoensis]